MSRNLLLAAAVTSGLLVGSAAIATPVQAHTLDCSGYEYVESTEVSAGSSSTPWSHFVAYHLGNIEICLDGSDGAELGLTLQQIVGGEPETVAISQQNGPDKKLSFYSMEPAVYRVKILGRTGGSYTVGLTLPAA
ncbi:hypothetical protein [Amycolatopsis thailandensis]|uniref:hypothetical protein n=1 Tax=Amycolatopsis thailandensis TaxID=589330 RepID=UPI0036449CC9